MASDLLARVLEIHTQNKNALDGNQVYVRGRVGDGRVNGNAEGD